MQAPTRLWSFRAALFALAVGAWGQEAGAQEAALELARFAGEWTFDRINGQEVDGGSSCEMLGDHIVWCVGGVIVDGVENRQVFSVRYDAVEDAYWSYRFYQNGYADSGRAWVDGSGWKAVYELPNGALDRFTATYSADGNSVDFAWHQSQQGGDWVAGQTGSMTRRR